MFRCRRKNCDEGYIYHRPRIFASSADGEMSCSGKARSTCFQPAAANTLVVLPRGPCGTEAERGKFEQNKRSDNVQA